jgi:hypothetical protein
MTERDLVRDLCIISVDLSRVDRLVVHNKHWWNFGRRYTLAHFSVKLIPGHADLKFQFLNGGKLLNSEEDRVEVTWGAARVQSVNMDELNQLYAV